MIVELNRYPMIGITFFLATTGFASLFVGVNTAITVGAISTAVYWLIVANNLENELEEADSLSDDMYNQLVDSMSVHENDLIHLVLETAEGRKVTKLVPLVNVDKEIEKLEGTKAKLISYRALKELSLDKEAYTRMKNNTQAILDGKNLEDEV